MTRCGFPKVKAASILIATNKGKVDAGSEAKVTLPGDFEVLLFPLNEIVLLTSALKLGLEVSEI